MTSAQAAVATGNVPGPAVNSLTKEASPASRPRAGGVASIPGTVRPVLLLVLPALLEQVLAISVGFTDKWLAGNLLEGPAFLAAVGLVGYALGFLPGLFAVPAVAATALVARCVGGGDLIGARRAAGQAFVVGSVLVGVVGLAAALGGRRLVMLLGLPTASTGLAMEYLEIVIPALPAMMIIGVGVAILRGSGDMVAGLMSMTVVNLVNAGTSYALAVGVGGLPRLGWKGLAWGTLIGYGCGAICTLWLLTRRDRQLRPAPADLVPDGHCLRRVLSVGLPAGMDAIGNAICHLWFLSVVNRLGDVDAAAHAVAITIESLAFLPGSAFGLAAATLSGQFLGARDERRARQSVWLAAAGCVGLMSAMGALFFVAADPLAGWFVGGQGRQSEVASLTARLVRIVAFAQPPLALLMVFSGGLRGAGATRPPLVVNFLGLLVVRLPLAMLLAWPQVPLPGGATIEGWGWGAAGAWYAMAIDLTVRGVAMALIFSGRRWMRAGV